MKMILHYLRKELAISKVFFLMLVGAQLIRLVTLLGWLGPPADAEGSSMVLGQVLGSMVFCAALGLISPLVMSVLLVDSPFRREGFLSTRPSDRRELLIAKVLAILLVVVVPPVVAEGIYLSTTGLGASLVLLGMLQVALGLGIVVLTVVPFVWLWRSKREGFAAGVAVVVGFIVFMFLCGWLLYLSLSHYPNASGQAETRLEAGITLMRILAMVAILGGACWGLLWVYREPGDRGFGWRFGAVLTSLAAVVAGLWFLPREVVEPDSSEEAAFAIAKVRLSTDHEGEEHLSLVFEPGASEIPRLHTVGWEIAGARVDGRELKVASRPNPKRHPKRWISWHGSGFLGTEDLRRELGGDVVGFSDQIDNHAKHGAQAFLPREWLNPEGSDVELRLRRHYFRWHRVADLPLKAGARSGAWKLEGWGERDPGATEGTIGNLSLALTVREKNLWINGEVEAVEPWILKAVLLDEVDGVVVPAESVRSTAKIGQLSGTKWTGLRVEFRDRPLDRLPLDFERYRIVLFQPRWSSSDELTWAGHASFVKDQRSRGLARDAKNVSLEDFDAWFAEQAPLAAGAGERDVARYLVEVLERTNHLESRLPEDHEAERALVDLLPKHLPIFLRAVESLAMDHHYSRSLLERAISKGIEKADLEAHLALMIKMGEVRRVAVARGWLEDLADELAAGARAGDQAMFMEAVQLPDRGGLSIDECLYLFRRQPQTWSYLQLRKIKELRPLVDDEVDQWFDRTLRRVSVFSGEFDPALRLMLKRGHPDGPRILQKILRRLIKDGTDDLRYHSLWIENFERMDEMGSGSGWAKWFMDQDPMDFVFDEKKRRYVWVETATETK